MDTTADDLPVFPTTAPPVFADADLAASLIETALARLADVVDVAEHRLDDPTPCAGFTVGALRDHVLGWLQLFAAAVDDPDAERGRPDAAAWTLGPDQDPAAIVTEASARLSAGIRDGAPERLLVMSQARMRQDGVVAMALGEYLVHGWDLAVSTGRPWQADEAAADAALAFLRTMVTPEYRGPDSGFFDAEVEVSADADAFERLLGFAGRDPRWTP